MCSAIEKPLDELLPRAQWVQQAMQEELDKLGFDDPVPQLGDLGEAIRSVTRDPASGTNSYAFEWCDAHGHRIGGLLFHSDGSFFAEYDVIRAHPANPKLFVEAVSAWGRDDTVKSEARLLPMAS